MSHSALGSNEEMMILSIWEMMPSNRQIRNSTAAFSEFEKVDQVRNGLQYKQADKSVKRQVNKNQPLLCVCQVSACVMLPISLLDFDGHRLDPGHVLLHWKTTNEVNNAGFYVERSLGNEEESLKTYKPSDAKITPRF
jgi:hypothetical protein